jgi:glucose uptake protein
MILPGSQLYNLILLAFGMLCLGTWAVTFRMTSKWRFELYYFDFAIGTVLAALIIGFTFGSMGWDGFALMDDLRIAGKMKEAQAMMGGAIFNFGNMLIMAALSVAGLTVAYLIGVALMLAGGMVIVYVYSPAGNGVMLWGSAAVVFAAAILMAVSYRMFTMERLVALMREGKTKSTRKVVTLKGQLLAIGGGLVAGGFYPLLNAAKSGENGLGPYGIGLFFAVGIAITTVIFNLFFMNLPVHGDPVDFAAYFNGKAKFHWLGIGGGALFYIGLIATLVAARAEGTNIVAPLVSRGILLGSVIVGLIWGLFGWGEFSTASGRIKGIVAIAVFIFVVGAVGLTFSAAISTAG